MSGRIDYEKARRRSRARDYDASPPLYAWHKRPNKFETRCAICGGPVLPGKSWMRKKGDHWQVAHIEHAREVSRA